MKIVLKSQIFKTCFKFIYVHNKFQCFDINVNQVSNRWEYLCVGLSHRKPHSKKYIICNVYRKPGGTVNEITKFTNEFCNLLNELKRTNHRIYTCGDFNINLLNINTNNSSLTIISKVLYHTDFILRLHFPLA